MTDFLDYLKDCEIRMKQEEEYYSIRKAIKQEKNEKTEFEEEMIDSILTIMFDLENVKEMMVRYYEDKNG